MARLWVKIMRNHRIHAQVARVCAWGEQLDVLTEICRDFDIPTPLWLNKQYREFDEFRQTSFTAENFMEAIPFQSLDIEFLADDDKKRRSNDPRNQFDGF